MSYIHNFIYIWRMRGDPQYMHILMVRLWTSIIVVCTMATITSISFITWTMLSPSTEKLNAQGGAVPGATETISRTQLKGVLTLFEERGMKYKKLSSQPPSVTDPSNK